MMKNNAVIYELITESQGDLADRMHEAFDKGFEQGLKDNSEEAYQKGLDDAWEATRKICTSVLHGGLSCDTLKYIFGTYSFDTISYTNTASEAIEKIKAYEEQKKAEEAELKVGTRVRTTKNEDFESNKVFPVGTIGVIEEIDTLRKLPYKISANGDCWFYSRDMFEVIDDEIIVGDEVIHSDMGTKAVVLDFVGDDERIMVYDENGIAEDWELSKVRKTGRTFPQIAEVLKQLQEGEE